MLLDYNVAIKCSKTQNLELETLCKTYSRLNRTENPRVVVLSRRELSLNLRLRFMVFRQGQGVGCKSVCKSSDKRKCSSCTYVDSIHPACHCTAHPDHTALRSPLIKGLSWGVEGNGVMLSDSPLRFLRPTVNTAPSGQPWAVAL